MWDTLERGTRRKQVQPTSNRQWFNRTLAEQASKIGIFTWVNLKSILKGFLYEETVLSQGLGWFEELMLSR